MAREDASPRRVKRAGPDHSLKDIGTSAAVTGPPSPTTACGQLGPVRNEHPARGPIAAAVAADLARMTPRLDRPDASLMAVALTLAQTLDDGAGMATAAVARELRATLAALTPEEQHDDDGFAALIEQLRAPVGDSPKP